MEAEEYLKEQMEQLLREEQTSSLTTYAEQLTNGLSNHFSLQEIFVATIEGKSIFASPELIDSLKTLILYELENAIVIMIEILGICIIAGLCKSLSNSFGTKSTAEIAVYLCVVVIVGLAMVNYHDVYLLTENTMHTMAHAMELLVPVLIGILVSMGQITSGTILHPMVLSAIAVFVHIIKKVILPALFIATVFATLNCLTEKDYVNHASKMLRQGAMLSTGFLITLLSGIFSIQGLLTKTTDNLLIDSTKYALDAFIPIVGGFTADTIELFLTCMGSIKSIIGIFGVMLVLTIILTPIIKIIIIAVVYKLAAMLVEPITSKKLAQGINDMGASMIALSAILFLSSLMFVIFIASLMRLGGGV